MTAYVPHTIRIRVPNAQQVSVGGEFNNWHSNAHPLVQTGPDLWERLVDLPAGKSNYAFFVIDDPEAGGGAMRSRVVGRGGELWMPEPGDEAVSVVPHPKLKAFRALNVEERLVA